MNKHPESEIQHHCVCVRDYSRRPTGRLWGEAGAAGAEGAEGARRTRAHETRRAPVALRVRARARLLPLARVRCNGACGCNSVCSYLYARVRPNSYI